MDQPDRNNTNFPIWNYERLKALKFNENDIEMYHQFLVRNFLLFNPKQRGILIFHFMGLGKSRTAANIIKDNIGNRQIVLIAPKKVMNTFSKEMKTVGVDPLKVHMISLKANNLTAQIERLPGQADEEVEITNIIRKTPLDNSNVFIDESHNLFNGVVNGSQNAVDLYDSIMAAKNIKVVFLSGSPISNTPFELVPCFNMLAGKKIFPENQEDFEKFFISKDGLHAINTEKFKNRIFGLVSYYGDWVQAVVRVNRPNRLPTKVIQVPMSDSQYAIYTGHRDKEREEKGRMGKSGNERFAPKNSSSTYRIRSRQASNFTPTDGKHRGLDNVDNCPKFYKAMEIITKHKGQPGMICSNFVNNSGLRDLAELLRINGWTEWKDETSAGKRYAIIAGDVDEDDVSKIQEVASSKSNIKGEIIQLVLIGPAGSEGIGFAHFRYGIIMDPFFNAVRTDQFEARIDRYNSHVDLPAKDRTIQMYHLLATYPENVKAKELSTDNDLYNHAKQRKLLSLEFYKLMIEASIDCPIHRDGLPKDKAKKINCLMCSPNNQALFTDRLDLDCKNPNPCHPPKLEKVAASEIVIETSTGQKKFMYTRHADKTYEFFEFQSNLGGYLPIARNHKDYELLMETVGR